MLNIETGITLVTCEILLKVLSSSLAQLILVNIHIITFMFLCLGRKVFFFPCKYWSLVLSLFYTVLTLVCIIEVYRF